MKRAKIVILTLKLYINIDKLKRINDKLQIFVIIKYRSTHGKNLIRFVIKNVLVSIIKIMMVQNR